MKTSKNRWSALRVAGFVMFVSAVAPAAHAIGFVLNAGGTDNANDFRRTHQYFFTGAMGVSPLVDGANWQTTLTDAAGAGGARNLTVNIQHMPGGPVSTFSFPGLKLPAIGAIDFLARGEQRNHGTAVDMNFAGVSIFAAGGEVATRGLHTVASFPFGWSLENPPGALPLTALLVTPSYREVGTGNVFDGPSISRPNLASGMTDRGPFPASAVNPSNGALGRLSDYKIQAFGSGQSETTLAFVGNVDGTVNELDLAPATSLFVGSDAFLVPLFTNTDNTSNLFVAVDLTQWLDTPGSSSPSTGESFSITDGTNPSLPGFLFSTSPIDFVPGTGFVTASPLGEGNVSIRAVIDGTTNPSLIPEPPAALMFGMGFLLIMAALRRLGPSL